MKLHLLAYTLLFPLMGADVNGALVLHGGLTTNITGSTQCVQANSSGVLSGTGAACGSGGGTPGGSSGQVQYNNGGAFGGIPGTSYVSGSNVILAVTGSFTTASLGGTQTNTFTCGDSQQCQNVTAITNYAGSGGILTQSSVYIGNNFAGTGSTKSTHVLDFVSNSANTGSGPISLNAVLFSGWSKSGTGTIDERAFFTNNETISNGTVTKWLGFENNPPSVTGSGVVSEWDGMVIQAGTPSAGGPNVGIVLGSGASVGQGVPNGVFIPLLITSAGGTSYIQSPLNLNQNIVGTSGNSCIVCFTSVNAAVASSGNDALIYGSMFSTFASGSLAAMSGIDLTVTPDGFQAGTVTTVYGARMHAWGDNSAASTNIYAFSADWGMNSGTLSGDVVAFHAENIRNNFSPSIHNAVGLDIGTVTPGTLTGTAYNIRTSDTAATNLLTGKLQIPNIASSSAAQTGTLCWTTSTGNVTVDTTTTCLASLEELKDKHGDIDNALGTIMQLRPFWFSWKPETNQYAGDKHVQPGLGAHQVESVDARLAAYDANGKLQGVRYQELVAVLVRAVQEQQAQINELKQRVR